MRHDPHKLVEGCLVAGKAMGARAGTFQTLAVKLAFKHVVCNEIFKTNNFVDIIIHLIQNIRSPPHKFSVKN